MHVDGLFPVFDDCPAALEWLRTAGDPQAGPETVAAG
jgi:hypothetical protein